MDIKFQIDRYFYINVHIFKIYNQGGYFPVDVTRHTFHVNLIVFPFCSGKRCADQTRDSYQIKPGKANYTDNNLSSPSKTAGASAVCIQCSKKLKQRKMCKEVFMGDLRNSFVQKLFFTE